MRDLLPNPTHLLDTLWPDLDAAAGYGDISADVTIETDPGEESFYYYSMTGYFPIPHTDRLGRSHGIAYAGFQTNGHAGVHDRHVGRMAIFSIWDGTRGVAADDGWATPFMENGIGWSVRAPYRWREGATYRIRVVRGEREGDERLWSASLTDLASGRETNIGSIAVPAGMGGLRRPITFHERYGGPSQDPSRIEASVAVFSNVTADGGRVVSRNWDNIHVASPAGHPDLVWVENLTDGVRSGVGTDSTGKA